MKKRARVPDRTANTLKALALVCFAVLSTVIMGLQLVWFGLACLYATRQWLEACLTARRAGLPRPAWPGLTPLSIRRWGPRLGATTTQTGTSFEQHCARLLQKAGWSVEHAGGSGDAGCDLLAKRRGVRMAVQCKAHAKPVGTRAVQEAHSGRGYHRASIAVVVATNGFTNAATHVAQRLDVKLVSEAELRRF